MYITAEVISEIEKKYGSPREAHLSFDMHPAEFQGLLENMRHSRAHDVTLFIFNGDQVAVIRKPMYPPGVFRAPSGGVKPGESFEAGALREAYEETGLQIELERYVLRARVIFTCQEQQVVWTSHVFTARMVTGEIHPIDTREVVEAFWVSLKELKASSEALRRTPSTGLHYRAALNDLALEAIESVS